MSTLRAVMMAALAKCSHESLACRQEMRDPAGAVLWERRWSRVAGRIEREPVRAAEEAERQRDEDEARREDADDERREWLRGEG